MEIELTPSEYFKKELEQFLKDNPKDPLNKTYESEFIKSGKLDEMIKGFKKDFDNSNNL